MEIVLNLLNDLKNTNSTNEKKEILKRYNNNETVKKVIYYTLNPFFKYWVTVDNINKYINENQYKGIWKKYNNMFELLDNLKDRTITWHIAIESIIDFLNKISETEQEILKIILNKDLGVNMGISLINKVFINENGNWLIPEFKVSLATKLEDVIKKNENHLDFENNNYIASRKLDWIRTIAIFNETWTDVKFYSRQWNEFSTLDVLKNELLTLGKNNPEIKNYVFDGEVCIINDNWIEDFKQIVSEIKRKNFTIKNPRYLIFDFIKKEDFLNANWNETFVERYNNLKSLGINDNFKNIKVLEHIEIDLNKFNEMLELSRKNNWEGLILRDWNAKYEWKRTKKMIKVKDFKDDEFEVINTINGIMPILIDWQMKETEVLASVEINYKGNIVNVWSWFSQEERLYYYKNPNKIIWKKITVKYFEETQDKDWNYSLRFPVYLWIRNYE